MFKVRNNQLSNAHYCLCVLLILSGCSSKVSKKNIWEYQEIEARSKDVPVSLHFDPVFSKAQQLENGSIQVFESKDSIEQIATFYIYEMEREGWENLCVLQGESDVLLSFEKPSRYCSITISKSSQRSKNRIKIYLSFKS